MFRGTSRTWAARSRNIPLTPFKGGIGLLAISAIFVTGIVYFAGYTLVSGTPDAAPKPVLTASSSAETADVIRVYFAPCESSDPASAEQVFIGLLKRAKKSIYGAFYELELQEAADALVEQHRHGVDVRLVSDSDYAERPAMRACIASGIPVVFDNRKPLMHDKFCVVDDAYVWTGSTNITENCMYRNDNNSVLIRSDKLAADYDVDFNKMFRGHRFGLPSTENVPYPEIVVDDTSIECLFSPGDRVADTIVGEIESTRSSIDFMAFAFTSPEIAKAMVQRIDAGVRVRGIFDARQARAGYSQKGFLAEHGAKVVPDQNPYTMHNKVIILDVKTVITGSYNFSKAAETKNDENVLIIHSPVIARKFEERFEALLPE